MGGDSICKVRSVLWGGDMAGGDWRAAGAGRQAEDEVMKSQTIQGLYLCGRNLHAKSETLTVVQFKLA